MTQIMETDTFAGQAVYNALVLKIYNIWVLSLSNYWIWRCPKSHQFQQYHQYTSDNHLDIGVGTGYYLKKYKWPLAAKLSLMDLNPKCLAVAKKVVEFLSPVVYQTDIFQNPVDSLKGQFKSISMNYLLHCLPGDMNNKAIAIQNAVTMLEPGGVLFGATIISDESYQSVMSKKLANFYNKKKIFSNRQDDYNTLKKVLEQSLQEVEIKVIGCVALFKGNKDKV